MKKLVIGMLVLGAVSAQANCDKTSTCLLIIDGVRTDVPLANYQGCRRSAIEELNYGGARKVKMKFWDDVKGVCIEQTFKR